VSPWPHHPFSVELSIECEERSGQDIAEESQDVFFEVASEQIHGLRYWHLDEKRHSIEADHYATSVDLD
jgi:hypothetical protein